MRQIKRPLINVLMGAIIGILYGLYLKTSIAITVILLALLILLIQKHKRKSFYYLIKHKKQISIFLISIFISCIYTICINNKFQRVYKEFPRDVTQYATVISEANKSNYYSSYEIKIQDKKFIMYLSNKEKEQINYGDLIKLSGEYSEPHESRNYKGFNYKEYLKTNKIYGTIKVEKIEKIKSDNTNFILRLSNKVRNNLINTSYKILPKETAAILTGILVGEKEYISEENMANFSNSSLSHILAISGTHLSFIILGLSFILVKSKIPRKMVIILIIGCICFFMCITKFNVSIIRASIMSIIMLCSKLLYRKPDVINSMIIALLIILFNNPFAISDIGLQLSFMGTFGIVCFNRKIAQILCKKINEKISNILSVPISAQILIAPIIWLNFNKFSTVFILSNTLAIPLTGLIIFYGYINLIIGQISLHLGKMLAYILDLLIKTLMLIARITGSIPFANIIITTPSILLVVLYYICILIIFKRYKNKKSEDKDNIAQYIKMLCYYYFNYSYYSKKTNNPFCRC